jgi:hypothetical protein
MRRLPIFEHFGMRYLGPIDGHDVDKGSDAEVRETPADTAPYHRKRPRRTGRNVDKGHAVALTSLGAHRSPKHRAEPSIFAQNDPQAEQDQMWPSRSNALSTGLDKFEGVPRSHVRRRHRRTTR